MDSNIKQIQLVPGKGGEEQDGGTRKRGNKKAKTFKIGSITKEGGGGTSPGTMTQLAASQLPGNLANPAQPVVGRNSALTQAGAPLKIEAPVQAAGAPVKVVLAAAKKKKGVLLAAAKPASAPIHGTRHKRHTARKIHVSIAGLSKKIHRAKTIRHKATKDSIEHVKKELEKAGLIKAGSKAPEDMLRQMYADFMTLKNRAL